MVNCPKCGSPARFIPEYNAWYCDNCQEYVQTDAQTTGQPEMQQQAAAQTYQQQQPSQQQAYQQRAAQMTMAQQLFADHHFTIKQKLISVAHKYFVRDSAGQLVAFVHQKMFKLKEDIRIYSDESKTTEIMRIQQANILDFSGSFQVIDSQTGELVGILKRKGLKSMLKDEWKILDAYQNEMGLVKEQGGIIWLLRRFKFKFIPYKYFIHIGGQGCGTVKEKFQIIGDTYFLDIDPNCPHLDHRLAVAICLMMDIGEHE